MKFVYRGLFAKPFYRSFFVGNTKVYCIGPISIWLENFR